MRKERPWGGGTQGAQRDSAELQSWTGPAPSRYLHPPPPFSPFLWVTRPHEQEVVGWERHIPRATCRYRGSRPLARCFALRRAPCPPAGATQGAVAGGALHPALSAPAGCSGASGLPSRRGPRDSALVGRRYVRTGVGAHSQGFGSAAARRCCTLRWKWRGCLGVKAEACSPSQVRAEPLDASEGRGQAWGPPSALIL